MGQMVNGEIETPLESGKNVPPYQEDIKLPSVSKAEWIAQNLAERPVGFSGRKKLDESYRSEISFEAVLDRSNFIPAYFLELGAQRAKATCLISTSGNNWENRTGKWKGTGILVTPNILLTNHHVLNSVDVAREARFIFSYELDVDGKPKETRGMRANPERLFFTSPVKGGFDFTFVWIDGNPGEDFGHVPLKKSYPPLARSAPANIIQHPQGAYKCVVIQENEISAFTDTLIHYRADADYGSSGSGIFDNSWNLIGLHHASVKSDDTQLINEGLQLSGILEVLEQSIALNDAQAEQAREILSHVDSIDPALGFFGSLGRKLGSDTPGYETLVTAYQQDQQDIDIAFWNIEWFTRHPEKIDLVAPIIRDFNLDIWAFIEASPEVTELLIKKLKENYGLEYACAFSEPKAAKGKQSTTVIWNTATVVRDETFNWPEEVHKWLLAQSQNPPDIGSTTFEKVDGKIFDRYPGVFRFRSKVGKDNKQDQLDFCLVPLHLKAMDDGKKRRQLASQILAAAIRLVSETTREIDWVIGGDYNATLASQDFNSLVSSEFVPLSATDEKKGDFTYLKRPNSLIDHIFVSANLARLTTSEDYFILALDRVIPDYVEKISDHRPALVRLSLLPKMPGLQNNQTQQLLPDIPEELRKYLEAGSR